MIVDGPIPERVLTLAAAATIFSVMLTLGLGILLREVRWVGRNPIGGARAVRGAGGSPHAGTAALHPSDRLRDVAMGKPWVYVRPSSRSSGKSPLRQRSMSNGDVDLGNAPAFDVRLDVLEDHPETVERDLGACGDGARDDRGAADPGRVDRLPDRLPT